MSVIHSSVRMNLAHGGGATSQGERGATHYCGSCASAFSMANERRYYD
jgi:hypothetical protein